MLEHQTRLTERVNAAIALHHAGQHEEARLRMAELWEEIGPEGDAFHRCALAHFMADEQQDPREELAWDLRALEAADSLTDEQVKAHHASLQLRAFYPSLHLNLAEDYRKLAEPEQARAHLFQARAALDHLPDAGYGHLIRGGIERLEARMMAGE